VFMSKTGGLCLQLVNKVHVLRCQFKCCYFAWSPESKQKTSESQCKVQIKVSGNFGEIVNDYKMYATQMASVLLWLHSCKGLVLNAPLFFSDLGTLDTAQEPLEL
jgi:hypothetical protein